MPNYKNTSTQHKTPSNDVETPQEHDEQSAVGHMPDPSSDDNVDDIASSVEEAEAQPAAGQTRPDGDAEGGEMTQSEKQARKTLSREDTLRK
jgi:hypothetical protein